MSARSEKDSFRRWLAGFVLAAGLLMAAGCGGDSSSQEPTLVFNCPANAAEIALLTPELVEYRAAKGVRLRLNPFSGEEKLFAMMAARQAPDIFYTNNAVRDRLAAEGRLLDLSDFAASDPVMQKLLPGLLESYRSVDGRLYSIPNYTHTCGVYYNRSLFRAAGISGPHPDWTWTEFMEAARQLTEMPANGVTPLRYGVFIPTHFIEMLELMNHARIEPNQLFLEVTPEAAEVWSLYLSLLEQSLMPDVRRVQSLGMQPAQLLESGRVAMLVEGVPHQGMMETLSIDWGLAPLPRFPGKFPRYFRSSSGGLSISAETRHPQEAWQALVWLMAGAKAYQPNPVLGGADFIDELKLKFPAATGTGLSDVWQRGMRSDSADPRYFVRFSSWTMTPVLSRFQPHLDRLWVGGTSVGEVLEAIPSINREVRRDLERHLRSASMDATFRNALQESMEMHRQVP